MRLNKKGLWFTYMGDKICFMWFWNSLPNTYYSEKLHCTFSSIKEYKKYMGSAVGMKERNIFGISYKNLISSWVRINFDGEYILVLTDIDLSKKPSLFWENIPYIRKMAFTEEVVILKCKDSSQMQNIVDSIESSFATAWGYRNGILVSTNVGG
jgi:hypothetical protein